MRLVAVIELFVLSGVVGVAVYCATCALHVWHVRNTRDMGRSACPRLPRGLRYGAMALMTVGVAGIALATVWHVLISREGLLVGQGLFTVQRPEGLEVAAVATGDTASQDSLLTQYQDPQRAADIAILHLRRQSLEIQARLLANEPPVVATQIVAGLAEASNQQQSLRRDLNELTMERDRVSRDYLRDKVAKQDEINRLQRILNRLTSELQQAANESELHQSDLTRYNALRDRNAISAEQYSEKSSQVRHDHLQVQKLRDELRNVQHDKTELERGLAELKDVNQQQLALLEKTIALLTPQFQDADARWKDFERQRAKDLVRAEQHRGQRQQQLEVERNQTEQQLAGLVKLLQVRAPFAGTIAYRAASPRSVRASEPVIVLAKADAFRFRVQLPTWTRRSLQAAGAVQIEFLEESSPKQPRFVQTRFAGRLDRWTSVPQEDGYGIAELRCEPPAESVRWLARGEELAARLVWRPPLYVNPGFLSSTLALALGLAAWVVLRKLTPSVSYAPVRELPSPSPLPLGHDAIEYGAEGTLLRMLGVQLRESIVRGVPDAGTIAAAEWALDRHRARAVRLLAFGLSADGELRGSVDSLLKASPSEGNTSHAEACLDEESLSRLVNLLRVISPESVPPAPHWSVWPRSSGESHGACPSDRL